MTSTSPNSAGGEMFYIRCDVRDEQNIKVLYNAWITKHAHVIYRDLLAENMEILLEKIKYFFNILAQNTHCRYT